MIDLSVIVPAYNCEKYIGRCLDSLLNQEKLDIEIVIVNDGSTDNTENICQEYVDRFKNIKLLSKKNEGQGIARNIGLREAKGKYITFVDSDDYVNKNCYSMAINILDENNADFFAGQIKKVGEKEIINASLNINEINYHKYNENKNDIVKSLLAGQDIDAGCRVSSSACDKIYAKKVIDHYNLEFYSEREYLSEDILFNIMFLNRCKMCIISDMDMYNYVTNVSSFCHTYQNDYVLKMHKMLDLLNSYRFDFSQDEFSSLVSEKMYGYIKSYMFQEVEHQSLIKSGKNIKLLCQQNFINRILLDLNKNNFSMIDYFIVFLSKHKLGLIIAFFYKIKLLIFRIKNSF